MNFKAKSLILAALLYAPSAFADMDVPVNKVTAYSGGHCKYDKLGGGDQTASGDKVREHTVEKPGGGFAAAAVPQQGKGSASIFKCFFRDDKNYPGIRFKASDHYDVGSNGMEKYDASHDCLPGLNNMSKPATTIVVEGSCGGVRGGAGDAIPRAHHHAKRGRKG
jgi:hypothetical protein